MFCQLDQVKQILDIATAVRNILVKDIDPGKLDQAIDCKACSIIYGLLLVNDYDVFIQDGLIIHREREYPHFWVEVYLDGEAFVLDTTLFLLKEVCKDKEVPDIYFMPKDEAIEEYCYGKSKEYDWQREECDQSIWQKVFSELNIKRPLEEVLEEISELTF